VTPLQPATRSENVTMLHHDSPPALSTIAGQFKSSDIMAIGGIIDVYGDWEQSTCLIPW
jgi:hypothetical protein